MTKIRSLRLLLIFCSLCFLANCSGPQKTRTPNAGVELSTQAGISLIRVANPLKEGHGRFELNEKKQYELETFSLDAISLIELIAPNYRASIRCDMPVGRYDFFVDCPQFPSENPIMQRLAIQQASYQCIQSAFRIKITMDIAKRTIVVSD